MNVTALHSDAANAVARSASGWHAAQLPRALTSGLPHASGWRASLALQIARSAERSILARVRHEGPLRVQRAFYPESDGTCHLYLLHPPGGVVQGDVLEMQLDVATNCQCLVTTPGATKFYRSETVPSHVSSLIHVASRARCEWLPQESIVFDGAKVELDTEVQLAGDATFIGWEITCLGRPAANERFTAGRFTSRLRVVRDEKPVLHECLRVAGGDPLLAQPWGLRGFAAFGTLMLVTPGALWVDLVRDEVPELAGHDVVWAGTELDGVSVFRAIGATAATVRRVLSMVWDCCRRRLGSDGNHRPRIWAV